MRKLLVALIFLMMMVSPAFAYYHEYISDGDYSGTMTNNNSVDLIETLTGYLTPSGECPHAQGTNYSDCVETANFTSEVVPSYDTKTGVLNITSDYGSAVNISLTMFSHEYEGTSDSIWKYDDDKTVAFHTTFKIADNTNFEGGEIRIYKDGDIDSGVEVFSETIENVTTWQYFVWYGWQETWDETTTFTVYLIFDNWREMPDGTSFYIDDLRFFTVETELVSPASPSLTARRDMCEASAEMGSGDCFACGTFGDTNVSDKVLAGNIHKSMETGGGVFIPCITLFYDGITTSRIPIGYLGDVMYPTSWSYSTLSTWKRANFIATTQDYWYGYGYYQIGTYPSYYYTHTLMFYADENTVEMTTFDNVGGWSGSGSLECDVSGSVPMSVMAGASEGLWRESIDITTYGCTGSQLRLEEWGSSDSNSWIGTAWMDIPFDFAPVCDEGWYCAGNQEYYLLPDCEVTNVQACSSCGCDSEDYRCQSDEDYIECVNSIRISFYENCTETDSFLCDIECISVEGEDDYCLGETVCVDVGDCPSALCSGNIRYYDPYCDGGSSSCKYSEEEVCEYDCIAGICTLAPLVPAFEDTSPTGIIQSIKDGVVGFISGFSTPFFLLILLIVVVILITGLISALFGSVFRR